MSAPTRSPPSPTRPAGWPFIGLGGVLYAWLYWRWRWSLWIVIGLHTFMNLWWGLWDLGENSLGGWAVWASRVLVIGAAITLTELGRARPRLGGLLGVRACPGSVPCNNDPR